MMRGGTMAAKNAPARKIPGENSKVPEATKYKHVQSSLDTGPTQAKVKFLTNRQVLRRRDEIFMRISATDLAELFEEYEKVDDEAIADNVRGDFDSGPRVVVYQEESKVQYDRPYLLLDVRTAEEFADCHMLQARSMPQRLLMQDKIHPEIYKFKNLEGKLIVLYEDKERLAAAAAHILVHRGLENIFVLTKGLVGFAETYPLYVEGDTSLLPPSDTPAPKKSTSKSAMSSTRTSAQNAQRFGRSGGSTASTASTARALSSASSASSRGGSLAGSRAPPRGKFPATSRDDYDDDDDRLSRMSELSIADSVISRCATRKTRF